MRSPGNAPAWPQVASRTAGTGVLLGAGALALALGTGNGRAALASLAASWLFFAGLAAGGVALAAAIRVAGGRWAGPVLPTADAMARFFLPAMVVQLLLVMGAGALLPGAAAAGSPLALALRELVPTAALFAAGTWHVRAARQPDRERQVKPAAVAYLVLFALALSLWAYDWVISLSESPPATALPALYVVGSFLSGLALVALVAALRSAGGSDTRHDLGKLLFAFAVVWSYLVWALYLAAWYGNVPAEAAPLLARWQGPYRLASVGVLGTVLIFPFGILFPEALKRRRDALGFGAAAVLLGLWVERYLLVLPSLDVALTPAAVALGLLVALGVGGAFAGFALLPARRRAG